MSMCHVIIFTVSSTIIATFWMVKCMGKKVKNDEKKPAPEKAAHHNKNKNKNQTTPIVYETDPATLEREKRQRALETRERMKKKREKTSRMDNTVKDENENEETVKKPAVKLPELHEDKTQPLNSDENMNMQTAKSPVVFIEPQPDTMQLIIDEENCQKNKKFDEHTHTKSITTTEEQLGEVQLVDNDPDCALKASLVKKQAREVAKKKQIEEAMMRKLNLLEPLPSPDDTLKNVSSLQYESQMSVIQKKRKRHEMKMSSELCVAPATSETAKCNEMIEPKSNELYAREQAEKVGGA